MNGWINSRRYAMRNPKGRAKRPHVAKIDGKVVAIQPNGEVAPGKRLVTPRVGAPLADRVPPDALTPDDVWLPAPKIRNLLGGISAVTFWRWRHDPKLRFPEGRRVNGRWYFSRRAALDWWGAQHAEAA
jgi:hypothetical protein